MTKHLDLSTMTVGLLNQRYPWRAKAQSKEDYQISRGLHYRHTTHDFDYGKNTSITPSQVLPMPADEMADVECYGLKGALLCPTIFRLAHDNFSENDTWPMIQLRPWPGRTMVFPKSQTVMVARRYPWCTSDDIDEISIDDYDDDPAPAVPSYVHRVSRGKESVSYGLYTKNLGADANAIRARRGMMAMGDDPKIEDTRLAQARQALEGIFQTSFWGTFFSG